jgi:hypothetical protein
LEDFKRMLLFHLNFTSKHSQFNLGYGTQIWKKKFHWLKE